MIKEKLKYNAGEAYAVDVNRSGLKVVCVVREATLLVTRGCNAQVLLRDISLRAPHDFNWARRSVVFGVRFKGFRLLCEYLVSLRRN
jgi:hypothetical protein